MLTSTLKIDYRLGGIPQYKLVEEDDSLMQIPDEIRKCVVFVCCKTREGMQLGGTAFFVSVPLETTDLQVVYIITAKHVIDGISKKSIDQKVYLRVNSKQGQAKYVETSITDWLFHPQEQNVDVAILNWAPPQDVFDYRIIPQNMAATEDVIQKEEIGVGDDVFLTGLFANHFGSQRNIPIVRIGNIASMPEEKVHTNNLGDIDAYLVEARSIGGLSGSPVFAYLGAMRRIGTTTQMGRKGPLFYWLGLMHGHFDLSKLEMDNLVEDSLTNLQINIGIAIVVPVWKILEVINQEIFMKTREEVLKEERSRTAPTADIVETPSTKKTKDTGRSS
jgi:hypothetical protein